MFNNLDDKAFKIVIDAMDTKEFKQDDIVINQGDDG